MAQVLGHGQPPTLGLIKATTITAFCLAMVMPTSIVMIMIPITMASMLSAVTLAVSWLALSFLGFLKS